MNGLTKFLRTKAGVAVVALLLLGAGAWVVMAARREFGESTVAAASRHRMFVCAKTGKAFPVVLDADTRIPTKSPFSGEDTGYPAETCYWTADGKPKSEPTYVLLKASVDQSSEPTFCPDCGRLVVAYNPTPEQRGVDKPPPTREEYEKKSARVAAGQ